MNRRRGIVAPPSSPSPILWAEEAFPMKTKLLRAVAAGLLSLFAIGAAFALNVDQTRIMSKRSNANQQPDYYRLTINATDPRISTGQAFGALGQNTFIKAIDCHVTTAFNASTTNVVTVGTTLAGRKGMHAGGGVNGTAGPVEHASTGLRSGLTRARR